MAKSIVSIAKGTDVEKLVEDVLEPFGGVLSLIKPRSSKAVLSQSCNSTSKCLPSAFNHLPPYQIFYPVGIHISG